MKRTALLRRKTGIMAAGLALAAFFFCAFTLILPATQSRGNKLLQRTLRQMEQLENYNLTIIEKSPQYDLSFKGRVENGDEISGILPGYQLEVIYKDNRLQMKQEEASEWTEAETLGLQGLAGFLITPLELLQNQKACFRGAIRGEEAVIGETVCQTAYFTVPKPEHLVQHLFPRVDSAGIKEVTIGAALAEPDLALKQLRILVEFTGSDNESIERCYYIEP
ncbi:MAG TPA: hypothetical protein PKV91_06210 [Bacillota bacterium]|nr:hypothetical protein [Bacillota bacterium]HOA35812.1 hypothetical protein [Bacillota bacterium]HOJ83992.1 hypothetical protein [Bacillota bacterium]HOL16117.1 hypothetical protein [Bacillota bacterium]HPZ11933.1 hypothetical protein [Bacillota bacterium]